MVFNFGFGFEKAESYSITELGQGKKLFVDEACRILNLGTWSLEQHVLVLSQCAHGVGALHLLLGTRLKWVMVRSVPDSLLNTVTACGLHSGF